MVTTASDENETPETTVHKWGEAAVQTYAKVEHVVMGDNAKIGLADMLLVLVVSASIGASPFRFNVLGVLALVALIVRLASNRRNPR